MQQKKQEMFSFDILLILNTNKNQPIYWASVNCFLMSLIHQFLKSNLIDLFNFLKSGCFHFISGVNYQIASFKLARGLDFAFQRSMDSMAWNFQQEWNLFQNEKNCVKWFSTCYIMNSSLNCNQKSHLIFFTNALQK